MILRSNSFVISALIILHSSGENLRCFSASGAHNLFFSGSQLIPPTRGQTFGVGQEKSGGEELLQHVRELVLFLWFYDPEHGLLKKQAVYQKQAQLQNSTFLGIKF